MKGDEDETSREDCTEYIMSVSLYSWFHATQVVFTVSFFVGNPACDGKIKENLKEKRESKNVHGKRKANWEGSFKETESKKRDRKTWIKGKKELSVCHKFWFSIHYIFTTKCCIP